MKAGAGGGPFQLLVLVFPVQRWSVFCGRCSWGSRQSRGRPRCGGVIVRLAPALVFGKESGSGVLKGAEEAAFS